MDNLPREIPCDGNMHDVGIDVALCEDSVVNQNEAGGEFGTARTCLPKVCLNSVPVGENFSSHRFTTRHFDEGIVKRTAMELPASEILLQHVERMVNGVGARIRPNAQRLFKVLSEGLKIRDDKGFFAGERAVKTCLGNRRIGDHKINPCAVDASLVKQPSCRVQ